MGTRGLCGFVHNGVEKLSYNHWDSYPSGLGVAVHEWLQSHLTGQFHLGPTTIERIDALVMVSEDGAPSPEQREALQRFANAGVSTGDDWYALLRECQGNLGLTLEAGYAIDGKEFAHDSLFCEWGYIVDVDQEVLEVYVGFQKEVPTAGRWAGIENPPDKHGLETYHPIRLIWSLPFEEAAIITSEQFAARADEIVERTESDAR